jgi:broad specificity phosphatase PhoE
MQHLVRLCRPILVGLATVIAWPSPSTAQPAGGASPALVILVRHADRLNNTDDSPLSNLGTQRAKDLAAALRHAGVTAIITTQKARTRATAQPLAAATGVNPIALDVNQADHIDQVVQQVRQQTGSVLVVGHSDTIPTIISRLGGPALLSTICGGTFDHLFILVTTPAAVHFTRARYGREKSGPGANCL